METKTVPNMIAVLKAIEAGNTEREDVVDYLGRLGLSKKQIAGACNNCVQNGYVTRYFKSKKDVKYTISSYGWFRLNSWIARSTRPVNPNIIPGKHGQFTNEILSIIASLNLTATKSEIESQYTHGNFEQTLATVKYKRYVEESSGKFSLTPKGFQRLHILDMQINDTFECMHSSKKCTNAMVAALKSRVTTKPSIPTRVEVVAFSAPKPEPTNNIITKTIESIQSTFK